MASEDHAEQAAHALGTIMHRLVSHDRAQQRIVHECPPEHPARGAILFGKQQSDLWPCAVSYFH
jgi:hypothetical protein